MKPLLIHMISCLLFASAGQTYAALDIVPSQAEGEQPIYLFKDTSTGQVLGTFWNREKETSDYGFESSIMPEFVWSENRDYVAVSGGASRSRMVYLYKVAGKSLKEIQVPQLTEEQATPIGKIPDVAAEGTDAVRWQSDGTLLLRFWASGRVNNDSDKPQEANVWADLGISNDKATIVGTSSEEPKVPSASAFPNPAPPADSSPASAGATSPKGGGDKQTPGKEDGFSAKRLAGVHQVSGHNPDGTMYKGKLEIRVVKGFIGVEWRIGETVSHGNGVLVGQTLGVALDDGLAIYRIVGQTDGQSLIGRWASAGAAATNDEVILIGNSDMTKADFPVEKINGKYLSLREVQDGQIEVYATISGGDFEKKVLWNDGGKTSKCQALALGDGLAVLTPAGLSVYEKHLDDEGRPSLVGTALDREGRTYPETFNPTE